MKKYGSPLPQRKSCSTTAVTLLRGPRRQRPVTYQYTWRTSLDILKSRISDLFYCISQQLTKNNKKHNSKKDAQLPKIPEYFGLVGFAHGCWRLLDAESHSWITPGQENPRVWATLLEFLVYVHSETAFCMSFWGVAPRAGLRRISRSLTEFSLSKSKGSEW